VVELVSKKAKKKVKSKKTKKVKILWGDKWIVLPKRKGDLLLKKILKNF
jgi:hypothetical protein